MADDEENSLPGDNPERPRLKKKQTKKKKGKKKRAARKEPVEDAPPPRKKRKNSMSGKKLNQLLEQGREEARLEFENERKEVLDGLPETYKAMFKQIGFAKWGNKQTLPCLILSPYDTPPNVVREDWFTMLNNVKKRDRVDDALYLVYWYGYANDLGNCYSFVTQNKFILYEDAVKQDKHHLPASVRKKIDGKKKLTKDDQAVIRGHEEMAEDLEKDPEERKRGVTVFKEKYEMLTVEDVEDLELDSSEDDGGSDSDNKDTESPRVEPKKRKAKGKKSKKKAQAQQPEIDDDTGDAAPKGKKKKTAKAKPIQVEDVGDKDESENECAPSAESAIKEVKPERKRKSKGQPPVNVEMEDFGDKDESETEVAPAEQSGKKKLKLERKRKSKAAHHVAKTDDKPKEDERDEPIKEEEDNFPSSPDVNTTDDESDYDDGPDSKTAVTRGAKDSGEQDDRDLEEAVTKKPKGKAKDKRKSENKQETGQVSDRTLKDREREAFRKCEKNYHGLLVRWKNLIEDGDDDRLNEILSEILENLNQFSATFIEIYGISILIKSTKKVLKSAEKSLDTYQKVLYALKESYNEKKKNVPSGYTPQPGCSAIAIKKDQGKSHTKKDKQPREPPRTGKNKTEERAEPKVVNIRCPKKETSESLTNIKREVSGTSQSNPKPKPERKRFNLNAMLRGPKESSSGKQAPVKVLPESSRSSQLPSWMTSKTDLKELDDQRMLALDFILDMASYFPSDKTNADSIARSIEASIHSSVCGSSTKASEVQLDLYWKTVHKVVASVCGKTDPGSLFHLLLAGQFESADRLVKLKDSDFADSFEGRAVLL